MLNRRVVGSQGEKSKLLHSQQKSEESVNRSHLGPANLPLMQGRPTTDGEIGRVQWDDPHGEGARYVSVSPAVGSRTLDPPLHLSSRGGSTMHAFDVNVRNNAALITAMSEGSWREEVHDLEDEMQKWKKLAEERNR